MVLYGFNTLMYVVGAERHFNSKSLKNFLDVAISDTVLNQARVGKLSLGFIK